MRYARRALSHIYAVHRGAMLDAFAEEASLSSTIFNRAWLALCSRLIRRRMKLPAVLLARAFSDYPGIGAMHDFLAEACTEATNSGEGAHLEPVLEWLHRRFPDCAITLFFCADRLFQTERVDAAFALVHPRRDLAAKHDFLARLYATLLWNVGRHEECRAFYEAFFENYTGDMWSDAGFAERQREAIDRGLPPVLISTLPKSGSLFILNTLRAGLGVPHCALSYIGLFADLIPRRVRAFSQGGAVAVEHIFPTARDLGLLRDAGLRKLVFHTRDIRQVALSFVHHTLSDEVDTLPRQKLTRRRADAARDQELFEIIYCRKLAEWLAFLDQWAAFLETDHGFEIKLTTFDDLTGDEEGFFRGLLGFFGVPEAAFDWSVLARSKQERAGHFRRGEREEWRSVLSPETQARAAEMIARSPRVARTLD